MGPKKEAANTFQSTLMYIEAEAKMDSFQAQDGTQRTALNLLQRMLSHQGTGAHLLTIHQAISRLSQGLASRAAVSLAAPRARLMQPTSRSVASALHRGQRPSERVKELYDIHML
jgi:hypothetical protein